MVSINVDALRRPWFHIVLGWVTVFVCGKFVSVCKQSPKSTQPGHPFVGRCKEYHLYVGDVWSALKISDALEYVEKLNAVHRDIAARNVLVASDRTTVKLSDFGMSRFLTSDYYRILKDVQIPLLWSAPEVVQLHKYTIKSDVWSFGVFMVEMFIYGERPYGGLDPVDFSTWEVMQERVCWTQTSSLDELKQRLQEE